MSKGIKITSLVLAGAMLTGAGAAAGTFLTHNDADARIEQAEKEFEDKYNVQVGYTEEEMQEALKQEREKAEKEKQDAIQQAVQEALQNASAQGLTGDIDEFLNLYKNKKTASIELDDKIFIVGSEDCPGVFAINKTNKNVKKIDLQLYSSKVTSNTDVEYFSFGNYLYLNLYSTETTAETTYKINSSNLTIESFENKFRMGENRIFQYGNFYYVGVYELEYPKRIKFYKISLDGEYSILNYYDENNEILKVLNTSDSNTPKIYGDFLYNSETYEDTTKKYKFFEFLENGDIKALKLDFDIQNSSIQGKVQDIIVLKTPNNQDLAVYNTTTKKWIVQLQKGVYGENGLRQTSNKFFIFYTTEYGFYKWDLINNTLTPIEELEGFTSVKDFYNNRVNIKAHLIKKPLALKFKLITIIGDEIKIIETPILTQDYSPSSMTIQSIDVEGGEKNFIKISYNTMEGQTSTTIYYDIAEEKFCDAME